MPDFLSKGLLTFTCIILFFIVISFLESIFLTKTLEKASST